MLNLAKVASLLEERRPGHTLPQALYTDPEVFEFDLRAIYEQSWIMIGFEVELPQPGSWLSLTIGRSPVVVLRDRSGALRGFFNSCRHRGAQICPTGSGRSARLVCPYHQWAYDLDGRLVHAGHMQADFDPTQHALRPIHVETVAGTVYVCLAENPPPFAPFREAVEPMLAPHDLLNAKVAAVGTLVEKANWKLVMENARECYHCLVGHPELVHAFPVPGRITPEQRRQDRASFQATMEACGLPSAHVEGTWWDAARFPLNEGCATLSLDGKPLVGKPLGTIGQPNIGSLRWALEPHSFNHAVSDHVFTFSAMPTGPQETLVVSKWLVHKDAVEGIDYDVAKLTELWTRTNDQDRELAENNQRGVNSAGYVPGPYSAATEDLVLRFVDWYCEKARSFIADAGMQAARPALAAEPDSILQVN